MTVSIVYHTHFGNNARTAERLSDRLEGVGHGVSIHPISEARPSEIPAADLYLIGSPTQVGTLPGRMSRFLGKMKVPKDSRFGVFCTCVEPESSAPLRIAAAMEEHGAKAVSAPLILAVQGIKGPMVDGWEEQVDAWADQLSDASLNRA